MLMKRTTVTSFAIFSFLAPFTTHQASLTVPPAIGPYDDHAMAGKREAQPSREETARLASSKQIRPTMILWGGSAAGLVETITPAFLGHRKTWRGTHYPQDPTETNVNDYDLYDLDRETLVPLRSVRNTTEYRLELTFEEKEATVRKTSGKNTATERIPLSTVVQPEGPGLDVFVAGLPLVPGYETRYVIVDRWGGHGSGRVKAVTLSVSKISVDNTSLGEREICELLIKAADNSFRIREKVLTESPHFPVWVEYTRDGKTYPASEVIAVVSQP
jgi:hypothetical protein